MSIRARLDKLEKDLSDSKNMTKKYGEQAASSFNNAFKGVIAYFGASKLKDVFSSIFVDGIRSAATFEREFKRTEALIKSTGNAAGISAKEFKKFADELDLATLSDRDQIFSAINALQTFRSVSGETFTRAIELSNDLAEVLGGDIRTQAIALGKALEDPIRGITALRRSGVSFTEQQKDMIKTLVGSGQQLKAQTLILDEINKQVGGAAKAAAGGLAGEMDTLNFYWREFREIVAEPFLGPLSESMKDIAGTFKDKDFQNGIRSIATAFGKVVEGAGEAIGVLGKFSGYASTALKGSELAQRGELPVNLKEFIDMPLEQRRKIILEVESRRQSADIDAFIGAEAFVKERDKPVEIPVAIKPVLSDKEKKDLANRIDIALDAEFEAYDAQVRRYEELSNRIEAFESENFNQWENSVRDFAAQGIDWDPWTRDTEAWSKDMIALTEFTANAMQQNFSDLFFDTITGEFKSLGDYADAILKSIARAASNYLGQAAAQGLFGKDFQGGGWIDEIGKWIGASVQHNGGPAGSGPSRYVPASTFVGAPRFHDGLYADEFPAILQRGETVIPKGQAAMVGGQIRSVEVNIYNQNGDQMKASSVQPRMDINALVLDIVLDGADRNVNGFADQLGLRR